MGGSSGGSGSGKTTVRYAKYIEEKHKAYLDLVVTKRNIALADNPFTGYTDIEVDDWFFGVGESISSFPALFDLYNDKMYGVDPGELWTETLEDLTGAGPVQDLIDAEAALMQDDIDTNSIPRLQTGLRDTNSVMSSSYQVSKAIVEDARLKALAKFSAQIKYDMIPVAQSIWQVKLQWNQQLVNTYAELMKFYYSAKTDIDEINYSMEAKRVLWPFTILDYERTALGALQGAMTQKTDVAGASTAKRVLSGAMSGAAAGAMVGAKVGGEVGGTWGAGIGAVLGGVAGSMN